MKLKTISTIGLCVGIIGIAAIIIVLSVGASSSISATLFGILNLYFSIDFSANNREQILFTLYRIFVFVFPVIFVVLLIFYCLARKTKPSIGGILLDIVTTLFLIVPFTSFILYNFNR